MAICTRISFDLIDVQQMTCSIGKRLVYRKVEIMDIYHFLNSSIFNLSTLF